MLFNRNSCFNPCKYSFISRNFRKNILDSNDSFILMNELSEHVEKKQLISANTAKTHIKSVLLDTVLHPSALYPKATLEFPEILDNRELRPIAMLLVPDALLRIA